MKDCSYKPKKLPGNRALMVTEDWENYVTDLLEKMERVPPEVPKYDFKSIYDANRKKYKSYHEKAIFKMRFGMLTFTLNNTRITWEVNKIIKFIIIILQDTVWTN